MSAVADPEDPSQPLMRTAKQAIKTAVFVELDRIAFDEEATPSVAPTNNRWRRTPPRAAAEPER